MKRSLISVLLAANFCWLSTILAATPEVSYSGGDGSSFEKAIIVKAPDEDRGVKAEYAYIAQHYPGYHRGMQHLSNHNGRAFDILEFTTKEGEKRTLFFDISSFFGKY